MDWDAAEHLGRQMLKNDAWTKRIFEEFDGAASGLCWFRVSDLGVCVCAMLSYFYGFGSHPFGGTLCTTRYRRLSSLAHAVGRFSCCCGFYTYLRLIFATTRMRQQLLSRLPLMSLLWSVFCCHRSVLSLCLWILSECCCGNCLCQSLP